MSTSAVETALSKAKIKLLIDPKYRSAFVATILYGLHSEITESVATAATDGTSLFINPHYFMAQTEDVRISILYHEVYHVVLQHMFRLGNRDLKVFNIACDHAINLIGKAAGFTIPDSWYCDQRFENKGAEEIYAILMQENFKAPSNAPDHLIPPSKSSSDSSRITEEALAKAKIDKLIAKAAVQSKMAGEDFGKLPQDVQRIINELFNPKLDWRTILLNHLSSLSKDDYSYRRPNRKYLPNLYLPTICSESMGSLGVAFDASGSVSDKDFAVFKSEVIAIEQMLRPRNIDVVSFDTKIQSHHILEQGDTITDIHFSGRGGTSLKPVFEHFNKNPPEVLIVFSDLECTQWKEEPDYPVIWILVGHRTVPKVHFGTLIEYTK